jgi:hypothetical protein
VHKSLITLLGDIIYSSIGRHTTTEFWVGSRKQEEEELENIRKISLAVMGGKFSEDVWTIDSTTVKSRATIEVDGRTQGIGAFQTFFNPFRRKQLQRFNYAPYVPPDMRNPGTTASGNL